MMVVADNKKRVTLPVKPRKTRVTFKKVDGYTVGILNHPIDMAALRKALAEFP